MELEGMPAFDVLEFAYSHGQPVALTARQVYEILSQLKSYKQRIKELEDQLIQSSGEESTPPHP